MATERVQRRLERLLDQLDEAESQGNWESVRALAHDVLEINPDNSEAVAYLRSSERRLDPTTVTTPDRAPSSSSEVEAGPTQTQPTSFASGRYQVKRFLGEEQDQPYMVTELMGGGDVEGVIEDAEDHRLPLEQAIKIAQETCLGWSSPTAGASSTVI